MSETPTELHVPAGIEEIAREILAEPPKEVTPRRRRKKRTVTIVMPKPPVEAQTVEQRLAATKAKARQLAHEQKIRIPLRLAVSLETHESLVAIAEAVGPEKITDVAVHCMELGIKQMAGLEFRPRSKARNHVIELNDYGTDDEARARAAIQAAVQADEEAESSIQAERDEAAAKLHLPGRKRAAAL